MTKRTLSTHLPEADIQRFAEAKFPTGAACPRCGARDWRYADESVSNETLGLNIIDENRNPSGLFPTVIFECNNCGFAAPHVKAAVVRWLNDNE